MSGVDTMLMGKKCQFQVLELFIKNQGEIGVEGSLGLKLSTMQKIVFLYLFSSLFHCFFQLLSFNPFFIMSLPFVAILIILVWDRSLPFLYLECCSSHRNSPGWLQHIIHMSAKIVFQKSLPWQIHLTWSLPLSVTLPGFIFFIALSAMRNRLVHLFVNEFIF